MRVSRTWLGCALCLWACVSGVPACAETGDAETSAIAAGLARTGIAGNVEIVVGDERDVVEDTAAEVLRKFLTKAGVTAAVVTESESRGTSRFLLGREANVRSLRDLGDRGEVRIRDVAAEDDGFHLKRIGDDVVIAGANPRGVLYGVHAFEEHVRAGAKGPLDSKRVPYFRKRGSGLHYTDVIFDAELESFPEEKALYLSRLGINQLTDQGIGGPLRKFVASDVFPFQTPPDAEFQRRVKHMAAVCRKYGIDVYLFLVEPSLETLNGGYDAYPEEALGTVRPPWGGDKNGLTRTLCVSSPVAQEYLRDAMQRLVREYPDVKGVQLYNLDVGSWLCTPELCPRCKTVCVGSPPDAFNPSETQARLVALLADAAHAVNPDFDFRFWATVHYNGEPFERMIRAARGYNGLASSWTGSDRSVMVPDRAQRAATCRIAQDTCAERGVPFYMMCEFNNLEVVPKSLPFPFHVCDAIAKYKRWDVRNLTEIFGVAPEHNSINALVVKEFEWNPELNAEEFLRELAVRQFGAEAGPRMYAAWEEMRRAFDVWNDTEGPPFPLNGSQFHVKMGMAIGGLPPAIVPKVVDYYDSTLDVLTRVEPWLAEGYRSHKTERFLERMESMRGHLARAAAIAKEAVDLADAHERIGLAYYEGERPSCKEYAELNYAPIAVADALCRQRCNLIRASRLLKSIEEARAAGDEAEAREREGRYRRLVREDIEQQERFCDLLAGFLEMKPCYTRTSLTEKEIQSCISATRAKIGELSDYLGTASHTE